MNHCYHQDSTQVTTWTPGEARTYTCCNCGDRLRLEGVVQRDRSHGPFAEVQPTVTYTLPAIPCPKRGKDGHDILWLPAD